MHLTPKTGNTWTRQVDGDGAFVRLPTSFHGHISTDPDGLHSAEVGRYHLYVSNACPWAHRTLLVRALKGLTSVISVDVVHPYLTDKGWSFDTDFPGATGDRVNGHAHLQQVYRQARPDYAGIITVPVLWDKKLGMIVAETVDLEQIRFHYYYSHRNINPTGIVPAAPDVLQQLGFNAVATKA